MSSRLLLNIYIYNTYRQLPKKNTENRSTVNVEVCIPNIKQLEDYVDDPIPLNFADIAESDNNYDSSMKN